MTIQDQAQARIAWDEIAVGYDRTNTPSQMWVANEGLRRAELRPGMRFLDVAAGSGALSIPAARLGARVLATDISPAMLERLEQRARDEGLSVETRVMDGHALGSPDQPRQHRRRDKANPRNAQPQRDRGGAMMARGLIGSIVLLALWAADPAGAFIAANTIDAQSTSTRGGTRVRTTGPIGCTRGEHPVDPGQRHPAGDRSASAQELERPLHGRDPTLAGPRARPPPDPLRDRSRKGLRGGQDPQRRPRHRYPGVVRACGRVRALLTRIHELGSFSADR